MLGDEELHRLLDAGDLRGAGTWLVKRYAHEVHGLCSAMIRDRLTAEDLAQDVFSRAFSALPSYRREASSRTWLLAIARNRCIDHLRSQGRAPFSDVEPSDAPDESPLTSELLSHRADVLRALAALDEGERALVILRYRHGLSYDELANVFGLRAGATRMRVSRALSRMRAALERVEPLEELAAREALPAPRAPAPLPSAGRAMAQDELADDGAFDEEAPAAPAAAVPPPAGLPSRPAESAPPRRRAGVLSRIFGGSKGGAPGAARPAPDPLASVLHSLEPAVPAPFESRLLDLASQL